MQLHATVYTEQLRTSVSLLAREDTTQSKEGRRVCHLDGYLVVIVHVYSLSDTVKQPASLGSLRVHDCWKCSYTGQPM